MGNLEYRFKTVECYGVVTITDETVVSKIHYRGGCFQYETPLKSILPYSQRSTSLTTFFWGCLFIGLVGFACGVWGLVDGAGTGMSWGWASALAFAGLAMALFAMSNRTETWVWYPTEIPGQAICYPLSGPDAKCFDLFTKQMEVRIRSVRDQLAA